MENAKIDIYPSPKIRQMMDNDIELFEIFKDNKNSEPMKGNTNAFLNRLLYVYFNKDKYKDEMEEFTKLLDTYPMIAKHLKKIACHLSRLKKTIPQIYTKKLTRIVPMI